MNPTATLLREFDPHFQIPDPEIIAGMEDTELTRLLSKLTEFITFLERKEAQIGVQIETLSDQTKRQREELINEFGTAEEADLTTIAHQLQAELNKTLNEITNSLNPAPGAS